MALVLRRKLGEKIYIGPDVVVTLIDVERGCARLAIDAPREVEIYRAEILPPDHPQVLAYKPAGS